MKLTSIQNSDLGSSAYFPLLARGRFFLSVFRYFERRKSCFAKEKKVKIEISLSPARGSFVTLVANKNERARLRNDGNRFFCLVSLDESFRDDCTSAPLKLSSFGF